MSVKCPHCHHAVWLKCRLCKRALGDDNTSGLCRHCVCVVRNIDPAMIEKMHKAKKEKYVPKWVKGLAATIPSDD
jgi:hypothetical protein